MESVDAAIAIAVIGVLGTCVGGLIWVIKEMFNEIIPTINGLTKATQGNTRATKAADDYLRARNGRDNAMHKELILAVQAIPEQIIETANITAKALSEAPVNQQVDKQTVKTQVIKEVK